MDADLDRIFSDTTHWAHIQRRGRRWMATYGHGVYEYSEIMQWAWTEAGIVRKACRFIAKHQANDLLRQVRLAANVEVRWPAPTVGNVDAE